MVDFDTTLSVLEHVEETLAGLVHLEKQGELDKEGQVICIHTLVVAIMAFDLFLTGNVDGRENQDHMDAIPLLSGEPWLIDLSDGISILILRKPTRGDRRMVFLYEDPKENTPDPEVKVLWATLQEKKKPTVKFPVTDELFA